MITFFKKSVKKGRDEQERIYEECSKRLYNTSLRIVGSTMDAEEIVHDTLIKLFSGDYTFENDAQRNAWLTKVCVRASIDRLRKNRSIQQLTFAVKEDLDSRSDYDPGREREFKHNAAMVKEAMKRLPQGYKLVLTLYLIEGYDYQEISEILELQESTVRSQYIRGKNRLLELLEKN